jgi:inhibitor of cysteine peptidase
MKVLCAVFLLIAAPSAVFSRGLNERESRVVIELEGNPSTGYSWTYTADPEGIVREVSNEYRRDTAKGAVGTGGQFVFVFEALSRGETELRFIYARPWEKDAPPAESVSYTLRVNGAKKITLSRKN